jgi:hypothetical protein
VLEFPLLALPRVSPEQQHRRRDRGGEGESFLGESEEDSDVAR